MNDTLLSHRINTLLLNANAPFPSQRQDAAALIKDWRYAQRRLTLVPRCGSALSDRDTADFDAPADLGEPRW